MNVRAEVLERIGCYSLKLRYVKHTAAIDEPVRWLSVPRWYLWEGGFLLIGRARGVVPPHAHHAIQAVIAVDGDMAIRGDDDEWRTGRGHIVRPDAVHSFNAMGALGAMLFVDP